MRLHTHTLYLGSYSSTVLNGQQSERSRRHPSQEGLLARVLVKTPMTVRDARTATSTRQSARLALLQVRQKKLRTLLRRAEWRRVLEADMALPLDPSIYPRSRVLNLVAMTPERA